MVSKCTSFRELNRWGRSGSSSLKGIGRHSKNQAIVVLFLATFDLTQIQLESFGEELKGSLLTRISYVYFRLRSRPLVRGFSKWAYCTLSIVSYRPEFGLFDLAIFCQDVSIALSLSRLMARIIY